MGSYPLNLIAAEIVPVGMMVGLLVWSDLSWIWLEVILIPVAVALPFLLFPFAMMLWMAIDLFITPVNQRSANRIRHGRVGFRRNRRRKPVPRIWDRRVQ